MSSFVRTVQKNIMKRRGVQRDYTIDKDKAKIIPKPYPRLLSKSN